MQFTLPWVIKRVQTKTTFNKIYFSISLIIVLSLLVLIFYLSHQSGEDSGETSGWFTSFINFLLPFEVKEEIVRTLAHFSEFACLSFFMNNLFVSYKLKLCPVISVLLSFLYAITDEIHQIFVPERACQLSDMAVDLLGIISGMAVFCLIYLIFTKFKKAKKKKLSNS